MIVIGKRSQYEVTFTFPEPPGERKVLFYCECGELVPFSVVGIVAPRLVFPWGHELQSHTDSCQLLAEVDLDA